MIVEVWSFHILCKKCLGAEERVENQESRVMMTWSLVPAHHWVTMGTSGTLLSLAVPHFPCLQAVGQSNCSPLCDEGEVTAVDGPHDVWCKADRILASWCHLPVRVKALLEWATTKKAKAMADMLGLKPPLKGGMSFVTFGKLSWAIFSSSAMGFTRRWLRGSV